MKKRAAFFLLLPIFCFCEYYSQCGQDKIIHEKLFWDYKSGVFVDIGAHNGITFNNTYFFEKELGWTGICVEPIPEVFTKLSANRKCHCLQGCISDRAGREKFFRVSSPVAHVEMLSGLAKKYHPTQLERLSCELSLNGGLIQPIEVPCYVLNDVLKKNKINHVNLLSIDTEGGEFDILSSIDFSQYQIDVITVEDNYSDSRFVPFLEEKGYQLLQCVEQDLLFVHKQFKPRSKSSKPRVSIITSVYNGDEFVEGFLKDITQQTIFHQCELIMINANSPGHEEELIKDYMKRYPNIVYVKLMHDPGLYAVWNLAIRMASAEYLSNANLDDRSDPKALEIQVKELDAHADVDLVYSGHLITQVPNQPFYHQHANIPCDPPEFSPENMKYCLSGPRPVWRKSLHYRYGFFDESFFVYGDAEMWLRAVWSGSKFKKVPGFLTLFYQNPKGLSMDVDAKKTRDRALESMRIYKLYSYKFSFKD